jgi:acyl-CoA thioester hydrolase
MAEFRFYHPIEVRYSDLDPQGHVNNAIYLTYFEQARIAYLMKLGLWQPTAASEVGLVIADLRLTYQAPIFFKQEIRVGVRSAHLGARSLKVDQMIEDCQTGQRLAFGTVVLVAYNLIDHQSIAIPEHWLPVIRSFEGLQPESE